MDVDGISFQKVISFLKEKLSVDIHNMHFSLELLLMNNEVTDLLIEAVTKISHKLYDNQKFQIKFIGKSV